ncbi:MAG: ABC transporter substrate-binding protein [candidate division WOR-3 bacterium]|nr:ABC transporter substrate-binding protein [candidate division WOR-3 bacterium]
MRQKILLILGLIFFMIACTKQSSKKIEVTFWHAMGGNVEKVLQAMVADFESTHKHIDIKLVNMADYNTLAQKLMSASAVNQPPTIAQMYENWTTQLLNHNYLEPLDNYVKGKNGLTPNEINDIWPVLLANNTWNGKIITLPFNKSVPVYYYNIDLFQKAGIKSFPKTWEEFRQVCFQLKKRLGNSITPTANGTDIWIFASMLHQQEGRLYDEEHNQPLFNGPEAVRGLQFQVDLIYKDSVQSPKTGADLIDDFLAGRLAMVPFSCARRAVMQGVESFPIGMAPLPIWNKPAAIIYGTNIGLFKSANQVQKDAAWQFIKWFISKENQIRWSLGTYYVPIQKSALDDSRMQEHFQKTPGLKDAYLQMENAVFEPRGEVWFEGRNILISDGLEPPTLNKMTPKQALDFACQKLLARTKK